MKRTTIALCCTLLTAGCSNSMEKVHFFDRQLLPKQELYDATILRSRAGKIQSELTAPHISQYESPEAKTIYPKGVTLHFYDSEGDSTFSLKANYAMSWDKQGILMARDSVVIVNYESGDTIYLQDIVWNQTERRIFSNHPLHSKNGQRITYGDSFHSDEEFEHLQIVNQRGTIVIDEDEEENDNQINP